MGNTVETFSETETSQMIPNNNQGTSQGDLNSSLIITNHRLDGKNFLQWSQSELNMYYKEDWGEGEEHTKFMTHLNKERFYEFLAGLNRELDEVRGRILGRTSLPTIGEAFAEVRREEKRRLVMMGDLKEPKPVTTDGYCPTENSALISRGPQPQRPRAGNDSGSTRPWCSHCNRVGHTNEKCFKLHGYPRKNSKENKAALVSSNTSTAVDEVLDVRLTKNQPEALHKILGTTTAHGSLATQGTEIGEDDWHC
ncbi:hypothetical protein HRI_000257400 [Hibiscus trionum]|uniref:Uncharacterized protein n=1 Tax=Hibiscus trionum TaxID=183268 RepID=A0A9W7GW17_HIBTR|nr:hypothetical protein HRI_000257400 [Hibiscus trionum]